jgi:hypothetical protein
MKVIKIMLVLAITLRIMAGSYCAAQTFKLDTATSQRWAGGVVGHSGVKYFIELETSSKNIKPDTAWINGYVYPIDFSVKDGESKRATDPVTHKTKYTLWFNEVHNTIPGNPTMPKDTILETSKPVRQFEGAALISYWVKHKQRFFTIKSFTRLPQLNYP